VLWQGPQGQQATRHDETVRTDNGYTRESVFTSPQGATTTRNATVVNDPESRTRTRTVTMDRPDGG
jgi:hypothetical protein